MKIQKYKKKKMEIITENTENRNTFTPNQSPLKLKKTISISTARENKLKLKEKLKG